MYFYIAQEIAEVITKQARREIKINASGKLSADQRQAAEDFNVNHPLAKQYRQLLRDVWAFQEPEKVK